MSTDHPNSSLRPALENMPFMATVNGEAINLPTDLYIPPDAMKVFLEAFEGPFDFLLYLIRKQNLNILDIPVAEVTKQYMQYIDLMQEISLELAAEYLVMAAILAEIKSRMLLPRPTSETLEEDPRAELVRRLQEYERYKKAALELDGLPREERDIFIVEADASDVAIEKPLPRVTMTQLLDAFMDVLKRVDLNANHLIEIGTLSVQEKMTHILTMLQHKEHSLFSHLFDLKEGRLGIVVTFLALLELLKQSLIEFVQAAPFAPIYLKSKSV